MKKCKHCTKCAPLPRWYSCSRVGQRGDSNLSFRQILYRKPLVPDGVRESAPPRALPAAHLQQLGRVQLDDAGVDALRQRGDDCRPRRHVDTRRQGLRREHDLMAKTGSDLEQTTKSSACH